jgi:hypothetical protein
MIFPMSDVKTSLCTKLSMTIANKMNTAHPKEGAISALYFFEYDKTNRRIKKPSAVRSHKNDDG